MNLACLVLVVALLFGFTIFSPSSSLLTGIDMGFGVHHVFLLLCSACFLLPYFITRHLRAQGVENGEPATESRSLISAHLRPAYLWLLAGLAVAGVIVSATQVETTVGIVRYYTLLLAGGPLAEQARGAAILTPARDSGLPGFLRMFNAGAVVAAVILLTALAAGARPRGRMARTACLVIALAFVARVVLHMDRLPFMAIIPIAWHLWQRAGMKARSIVVGCGLICAIVAEVVSRNRGYDFGTLGYVELYIQSGMVNLSYLLQNYNGPWSMGLLTLFSPVYFAAKAANIPFNVTPIYEWAWSPALNGFGFAYLEWGWASLAVFGLHGSLAGLLDGLAARASLAYHAPSSLLALRLQAMSAYLLLSFVAVPASSASEYHLMVIMIVLFWIVESRWVRPLNREIAITAVSLGGDGDATGTPLEPLRAEVRL